MDIRKRLPLVFRPHFELSEPQNCTDLENVIESAESYPSLAYVVCATVIILHIKHHSTVGSSILFGLAASLACLVFTPFLFIVVGIFTLYRKYVARALEKEKGFMGLMEGSDAYWAGEHDIASRSIINVLLMLDGTKLSDIEQKPIDAVRGVMKRVLDCESTSKMACKKKLSRFGYWYYEKTVIDFEENVRFLEPSLRSKKDLEQCISEVANEPLIRETFWEILVAREPLDGKYPIIIRVHHSLGDGYALIKLFVDFMTDSDSRIHKFVRKESVLQSLVNGEYNRHVIHALTSVFSMISVYLYSSVVLAEQLLTPPDHNSLHNRIYLSGRKVCRTVTLELEKIKEVRRALNCRFTDVVMTALSNSMESCFVRWGENVDSIKTVLPARLPGASGASGLANTFTIGMMEIPLTGKNKLQLIQRMSERLKNLPDFYVNYWLLRVGFTFFPPSLLYGLVSSKHCTMAISNMPGPKSPIKIAGCDLTRMAFFLPNRDTTGVGISFLSYADQLNIGISIDASLLSSPDQANEILEGFINSIDQMHCKYVIN